MSGPDLGSGVFRISGSFPDIEAVSAASRHRSLEPLASISSSPRMSTRDRRLTSKGAEYNLESLTSREARFRKEWKGLIAALQEKRNDVEQKGLTAVSLEVHEELRTKLDGATKFGGAVEKVVDEIRKSKADPATKEHTVEFIDSAHTQIQEQLAALRQWLEGLEMEAPKNDSQEQQEVAATAEGDGASANDPPVVNLGVTNNQGSRPGGSRASASVNGSVVSSTTRKRLEAATKLKFLEDARIAEEQRQREDQERRRREREEEELAEERRDERERRRRQFEREEEERARHRRRQLEDEERAARFELELATEMEVAEQLGNDDPDRFPHGLRVTATPFIPETMSQNMPPPPKLATASSYIAPAINTATSMRPSTSFLPSSTRPSPGFPPSATPADHSATAAIAEAMMIGAPKLDIFNGDPEEWIPWVTTFEGNIASKTANEGIKFSKLWEFVGERVRKYIMNYRLDQVSGYSKALRTLWNVFGNPAKIADKVLERLTSKTSPIRANDYEEMMMLSVEIGSALETIDAVQQRCPDSEGFNYVTLMDTRATMLQLLKRLPQHLQREFVSTLGRHPGDLYRLHSFLTEKTKNNTHPILEALSRQSAGNSQTKRTGMPAAAAHGGKRVYNASASEVEEEKPKSDDKKGCVVCNDDHEPANCEHFQGLTTKKKWELLRRNKRCFSCFGANHLSGKCTQKLECKQNDCRLKVKHHPLLHNTNRDRADTGSDEKKPVPQANTINRPEKVESDAYMGVIAVEVRNPTTGRSCTCYAMIDSCSNVDVVTDELVKYLELPVVASDKTDKIYTVTGMKRQKRKATTLQVCPFDTNDFVTELQDASVMNCSHFSQNKCPTRQECQAWDRLNFITPMDMVDIPRVMVLISIKHPALHKPMSEAIQMTEDEDGPYAVRTKLGYTLYGGTQEPGVMSVNHIRVVSDDHVEKMLCPEDLTDVYNTRKMPSVNEQAAAVKMKKGMHFGNGKYTVPIPFATDEVSLPDNIEQARKCIEGMRNRFRRDKKFFDEYSEAIMQYVKDGHATEVPADELETLPGKRFFLLHHNVRHPRKKKIRIVFNLSKKFRGKSLNGEVIDCPDLLQKIVGVLLRFRRGKVGVSADIKSFFHAVAVPKEHADLMRFFWFKNNDVNEELVQYRMGVQVFGGTGSQAAAVMGLQDAIQKQEGKLWSIEQIEEVLKSFYSDDYCKSFESEEEAMVTVKQVVQVLREHGFELRRFVSNDAEVVDNLNEADGQGEDDKGPAEKQVGVLGVGWITDRDELQFKFEAREPRGVRYTKRECLSLLMSLYDPIGLLTPFVLPLKLLVHEMVIRKLDWDEEIDEQLHGRAVKCLESLQQVSQLTISRCYSGKIGRASKTEIHIFADGSSSSYGCAAYVRTADDHGNVQVSLAYAKNRLCPMSTKLTIPRVELSAGVMAVRMADELKRELGVSSNQIHYWTDSVAVIRYIRNRTKRFHVFVSNRIAEIRHQSNPHTDWRYVPTNSNPGDHCSRTLYLPIDSQNAEKVDQWFNGPKFLWKPPECWPSQEQLDQAIDDNVIDPEEVKPVNIVHNVKCATVSDKESRTLRLQQEKEVIDKLNLLVVRSPTMHQMRRRFAWLSLFIRWRVRDRRGERPDPPGCDDLKAAERDIVRVVQRGQFDTDMALIRKGRRLPRSNTLHRLNPQFDPQDRVLRVGTRLKNADIPFDTKFPVILPKKGHLTELLLDQVHHACGHQGVGSVLSRLREKYWVIGAKVSASRVIRKCIPCKRYNAKIGQQLMSDLPENRVKVGAAVFDSTSVDLFGPFRVKRARSQIKRYCALYTCMATRAVHLEIVYDLSTDSFIQSFRRFTARRGRVSILRSDRGTNLRGAARELADTLSEWNESGIGQKFQQVGVEWRFGVPGASHHNGVHERLIRSARECLRQVLETQTLDDEGLLTLVTEVEHILNSRPLQPWINDPNCLRSITPNDVLLCQTTSGLPPGLFPEEGLLKRKWRQCQVLTNSFWKRFQAEYLHLLSLRTKWLTKRRNFTAGDLVLLVDPNQPRAQWPLARIVETKTSEDGLVRSCIVKTTNGQYERPIVKLVLLEGVNEDEDGEE